MESYGEVGMGREWGGWIGVVKGMGSMGDGGLGRRYGLTHVYMDGWHT